MITTSNKSTSRMNRNLGFTLLELMITLVIVALLSVIAYPSFMQSVKKSKRTDAHSALTRTASNLERFFSTNGSYTTDTSQLRLTMNAGSAYSDNGDYVITVTAGATGIASSYVVTATAAADSIQADDTGCTGLSLDSIGRRTPDPVTSKCW